MKHQTQIPKLNHSFFECKLLRMVLLRGARVLMICIIIASVIPIEKTFSQCGTGGLGTCASTYFPTANYKCIGSNPSSVNYFSSQITATNLLSVIHSKYYPQYILLQGTFIMDIPDYEFTSSSKILMGPGAKIILNSTNTAPWILDGLYVKSSTIKGCDAMWNGIQVNSGGKLRITNSTISDGIYSVEVKPGARASIGGTQFLNNLVGIYVGQNTLCSALSCEARVDISNNEFLTDAVLKSPFTSNDPFNGRAIAGILISNMKYVEVGRLNKFHHIQNGIIVENSWLKCWPNRFYDIYSFGNNISQDLFGNGILARYGNPTVEVFKCNKDEIGGYPWHFSDCKTGVRVLNGNTNITFSDFEECGIGILVANNSASKRLNLKNNNFLHNMTGVGLYSNAAFAKNSDFSQNNFEIGDDVSSTYGIDIRGTTNLAIIEVPIHNNDFEITDYNATGIYLDQIDLIHIFHNAFTFSVVTPTDETGTGPWYYSGIRSYALSNSLIQENDFNGSEVNDVSSEEGAWDERYGMKFVNSPSNHITCNQFGGLGIDLYFEGMTTTETIEQNTFNGSFYGIAVGHPDNGLKGYCGNQISAGNWFAFEDPNPMDMIIENDKFVHDAAYNTKIGDPTYLADNHFEVKDDDPANNYWPFPLNPEGFFTFDPMLDNPVTCDFPTEIGINECFTSVDNEAITNLELDVLDGDYTDPDRLDGLTQITFWNTYKFIKQNPEATELDLSSFLTFYEATDFGIVQKWQYDLDQTLRGNCANKVLENKFVKRISKQLDHLHIIDSLIFADTDTNNLRDLYDDRALVIDTIDINNDSLSILTSANWTTTSDFLTNLRDEISHASLSDEKAIVMSKALDYQVQSYLGILDSVLYVDSLELAFWAQACYQDNGIVVYSANAFMRTFFNVDLKIGDDCSSTELRESSQGSNFTSLNLELIQNPVSNELKFKFPIENPKEKVTYHIYDVIGNILNSGTLLGSTGYYNVNVTNLHSGFYLLSVSSDKTQVQTKQFIKQ